MAISCDRIFVEGATEKIILSKLGYNEDNIEVKFGREEVIKEFKKYLSSSMSILKKGNVCFVIDGDEERYKGVYNRLKKDISALDYSPPYIKMCKDNLCYVLVVIGNKNDDFKGCIETILLEKLKIDEKINDIINRVLEYEQQKVGHLSICDRDKIRFYLSIFLLSGGPTLLYLSKRFTEELLRIVGEDFIRNIIADFIEIK
ncbi:hypothetical protein [Saccharolobus caldissimus]|uniref:Uncharacterized protein n=1 Tax=Saccharolobus caldissimus TaxID=1702097 RepID=A0AAQ4CUZ7_9CREN|nr:hypothetical protein [Saccharolobus caldissimus]BDB99628.1 hypothetical protein SACC_26450 [Saccharolobus caldissimus]